MADGLDRWHDFFVAEVGGGASLAGLLFVAISINIGKILEFRGLPERAGGTLVILIAVVLEAGCALMPQPALPLAIELIGIGGVVCIVANRAIWVRDAHPEVALRRWLGVVMVQISTLPCVAAGIALLAGMEWSLYCLAAGFIASLAVAVFNAWVLMVEILR